MLTPLSRKYCVLVNVKFYLKLTSPFKCATIITYQSGLNEGNHNSIHVLTK